MFQILVFAVSFAFAGPLPEDIDLMQMEPWERASETLLKGPQGCYEWVGKASYKYQFGERGSTNGEQLFVGRTIDGVWSELHIQSLGDYDTRRKKPDSVSYRERPLFVPLMGQVKERTEDKEKRDQQESNAKVTAVVDGDGASAEVSNEGEVQNIIQRFFDSLEGGVEYSYAEWDDKTDAVLLHRYVPLNDARTPPEAHVVVAFPGGGLFPSRLSVEFPAVFKLGTFPVRLAVKGAVIDLVVKRVGDQFYPSAERYSASMSFMGIHFSSAQTITYLKAFECQADGP